MKKYLLIILLVIPSACYSQSLERKNFEWESKPSLHKLDSAEAALPAVIIEDARHVEYIYNKDGELEEFYSRHRIVRISDSKAVDEFNKIYVAVSQSPDLIVFKARSIDKKGSVKEMLRGEMKQVDEKGQRYMSMAVDGLEKNSEVEYYFTTKRNLSYFRTEIIASDYRVRNCSLEITSPENIVIDAKAYNGFPQPEDTIIGRKRILTVVEKNIVPVPEEEYATDKANRMRVELKLAKNLSKNSNRLLTWADAGNEYFNRMCQLEKNEIKEAEKIAGKLQLKKKTEMEAIRAIENFTKTTIEVVENSDVGSVADIVKKNYADQYGMCRVTSALLKSAGIKFEIVVTISRYIKKFDPDFDTWNYLDDILLYIPSQNIFLAPTDLAYRGGLLPAQYIGVSGLFIREISLGDIASAVSSVKKIPMPDTKSNRDDLAVNIKFSPDMSKAEQKTTHYFSGYAAIGTRPFYFYAAEDKKKELLDELLKMGIDDAVITNGKASNYDIGTEEVNKPFTISGDIKYSSLIEKAGGTFLFNVGAVIGPQVQMYSDKKRVQPIDIEYLHSYDRTITIEIPAGYTAKELGALNMNIVGDDANPSSLGFISSYTLKGNVLEIKVNEFYNKISYPASFFDTYRKVINASADFNKIKIVLEKNSGK